jgi:hypothetical protein
MMTANEARKAAIQDAQDNNILGRLLHYATTAIECAISKGHSITEEITVGDDGWDGRAWSTFCDYMVNDKGYKLTTSDMHGCNRYEFTLEF